MSPKRGACSGKRQSPQQCKPNVWVSSRAVRRGIAVVPKEGPPTGRTAIPRFARDDLPAPGVAAVVAQIADILIAVAAITAPVAKVLTQVPLVLTTVADVLATLLARVVVSNFVPVLPKLPTILPNFMIVAAKLTRVAMNLAPARVKLVRFARRHSRVTGNVWMVDSLRANDRRTSNEQGCNSGSHSEIAHRIPQRYPALAVVACAARTTLAGRRC